MSESTWARTSRDTVSQFVSAITMKMPISPFVEASRDESQLPLDFAEVEILLRSIDMIRIAISRFGSA